MKVRAKRITGLLIVVAMLFSMVPTAFANPAADFVDFPTGWSYEAMTAAVNNGLLIGYEGNEVRPQANLTRAEMATIITRSFGAQTTASIAAYTDVDSSAWYYDYIAKAVKMGAMQGESSTRMNPEAPITREEVFTMLARVLVLEGGDAAVLNKFPDAGNISSWAKDYIIALAARGYVNGDHLGYVNPQANITREEFAQLMHNAIRSYISQSGTYTTDVPGITVVRVGDVHLKNFTNTSDLVIGDGAMLGEVIIEGVKIEKRLLARGGTITVKNSTAQDGVVVNNVNNVTPFKNYRDESFFKGIVEKTPASFLQRTTISGGSSSGSSTKKYELTFMIDGEEYKVVSVGSGKIGNKLPAVPTAKDLPVGYAFVRWVDGNGNEVTKDTKISSDLTVEAELKPIEYNISFKDKKGNDIVFDGFTPDATFNIENAASYVLPQAEDIVVPTHYTFEGWVDKNGNPVTELKVTASTTDTVLTAVFEPIPYTLTYSTDQAIDWEFEDGSAKTENLTIEDFTNSRYILRTDVKVNTAGYHFVTWLDENGNPVEYLTPETLKTMTLKAYFAENTKYVVTFANYTGFEGVEWSFASGNGKTLEFDAVPVTLPTDVTVTTADYEFLGWVDVAGNPITTINTLADITVYANFKSTYVPPVPTYTITFQNVAGFENVVWYFESNTPKTMSFTEVPVTLPTDVIVTTADYEFLGWVDGNGNLVTTVNTLADTTVYANFRYTYVPPTEYTITFANYTGFENVEWSFASGNGKTLGFDAVPVTLPTDVTVTTADYEFLGWVDAAGNPITTINTLADITVYANFKSTYVPPVPTYTITFENYTGFENVEWSFASGNGKTLGFDAVPVTLPTDVTVTTADYEFLGWVDGNGNPITTINTLVDITVYANFKSTYVPPTEYTITFANYTGFEGIEWSFTNGNPKTATFTAVPYTLPAVSEVTVTTADYEFTGWVDATGRAVLTIDTLANTTVYANFRSTVIPPETVTVTFYRGYGDNKRELVRGNSTVEVEIGTTIPEADIPVNNALKSELYDKDTDLSGEIASIYVDEEPYIIKPTYWYEKITRDENDVIIGRELVSYDKDVIITKDITEVYVLYQAFMLMFEFNDDNTMALSATANYTEDTRLLDSMKTLLLSGRDSYNLADSMGMLPEQYEKAMALAKEKLIDAKILDAEDNIQIIYIPIPIGKLVKEEIAHQMVRQFIRDVVADESRLDSILSMIKIEDMVGMIDIDELIDNLSDQEIADIMRSSEHSADIVEFILKDLKSDSSKMLDLIVTYVKTNSGFKSQLIDQLIAELKDETVTSNLKTAAIDYIKTLLSQKGSTLQNKFIDMLIDSLSNAATDPMKQFVIGEIKTNDSIRNMVADMLVDELANGTADDTLISYIRNSDELIQMFVDELNAENPTVMSAVVSIVQTKLADKTAGAELRKQILTNDTLLNSLLADKNMKAQLIDLVIQDAFIDKVMDDHDYRTALLEALITDHDFIVTLTGSSEFHDYIVKQLHGTNALAQDIRALLADEDSEFKKQILTEVKTNSAFLNLLNSNTKLHDAVLDAVPWSAFVSDNDDLLKYIFGQTGVTGTYSFVDLNAVESMIAEKYNTANEAAIINGLLPKYHALRDTQKQDVKNQLYADNDAKAEALTEMKAQFETYKESVLRKLIDGEALNDATAEELIDKLLVDYVTKYINQEQIHADTAVDSAVKTTIKEILFAYIRDLITGDFVPTPGSALETELKTMNGHIESIKHQFVADDDPEIVAQMKSVMKSYAANHKDALKTIIDKNYSTLTAELVDLIDPANSIYPDIDNALVQVAQNVNTAVITDLVKSISAADKKALVTEYVTPMTNAEIRNNLVTLLADAANKAAVKDKLGDYITSMDDTVLSDYLVAIANDAAKVQTIKTLLSDSMTNNIAKYDVAKYLATFLNGDAANEQFVRTELEAFLNDPAQAAEIESMTIAYLKDASNETQIKTYLESFLSGIDAAFVASNRAVIKEALSAVDVSAFVDNATIKDYIAKLDEAEKKAFADKIYTSLSSSAAYKKLFYSLLNEDIFEINQEDLSMVTAIASAIRALDYDEVLAETDNETILKIGEIMGDAFLSSYFDDMKNRYCDGLDAAIARVEATGTSEEYTTSLTLVANVVAILDQLYAKAQPIVVEKLTNRNVKYDENPYIKHLVEGHDIVSSLFDGDASLATETDSGYTLKGVLDYYNYLLGLLFVADDALIWYGDDGNLSQDEFDAIYDAIIRKALIAHEKLNEILAAYNEDGTLPAKVQQVFDKVQKLNDMLLKFEPKIKALLDKYFASDLNDKLENGIIPGEDKILTFVDILLGQEDPVFTIDSLYEIFYRYDDKVQAKLQQLIDSGKLEQVIQKFEDTEFGSLFRDNKYAGKVADKIEEIKQTGKVQSAFGSIYDLMQVIAKEGIEPFRTNEGEVNVRDAYQVTIGGITFTIRRDYQ